MTLQAVGLVVKSIVEGGPLIFVQLGLVVAPFMAKHATFTVCDAAWCAVPVIPGGAVRPWAFF
jgi:hypothetical protein